MSSPARGEVWLVDLGPVAKVRPALAVSVPASDDDRALVTICPHTTSVRGTSFEVDIPVRWLERGAFDLQNLNSIPHAKFIRKLGQLNGEQMLLIDAAMKNWLGVA